MNALIILIGAGIVFSQPYPQCFADCRVELCDLMDLGCICVADLQDITICAMKKCSVEDLSTASAFAQKECGRSYCYRLPEVVANFRAKSPLSGVASSTRIVASGGSCYLYEPFSF